MITNLKFSKVVAKPTPTNHVFVADVSYSMYNVLPKIRNHLKSNLATLVKPNDTVSVLYFSSKGEFGRVFVGKEVNSLTDLSDINNSIDRYLHPIGCTGFVDPLKLSVEVAKELSTENNNLNSLIFMTDGYDNCWSQSQILTACKDLPLVFNDITFMEYGWNCNRNLLEQMTAATNALHTFSEGYEEYEKSFEEVITAKTSKRVEVNVGEAEVAVYVDNNIYVVNSSEGIVLVPEHIDEVWTIGKDIIESLTKDTDAQSLYISLYYGVYSMNPDLVWKALKGLGDVKLIKAYSNCFTKQDYSNLKEVITKIVLDKSLRFAEGVNYNLVPDDNAKTVVDVLDTLVDMNAHIDTTSSDFSYNRTGRKSIQKEDNVIDTLTDKLTKAVSVEEKKAIAMELIAHEEWTPEFVSTTTLIPMNKLVTNGNRPNISISTDMKGFIELPKTKQDLYGLPEKFPTKIVRAYTLVKDGIINMKLLPVIIGAADIAKLNDLGVQYEIIEKYISSNTLLVNVKLDSVPLINRSMVKGISGESFIKNNVKLQTLKAKQKVLKYYKDKVVGKSSSVGFSSLYGEEAAKWLSSMGIRDYGFSPKTTKEESTDFYLSKELNVKIKGLSSLPSIDAVIKKIETGKKLNASDNLISGAINSYESDTELFSDKQVEDYLVDETKRTIGHIRTLSTALSKVMYGVVIGHSWFNDLDFDNPTMKVVVDGLEYDVSLHLEEKEIKI